MKKALVIATLSVVCVGSTQAAFLYDSLYTDATHTAYNGPSDTGSLPRTFKADTFTLANRGASPSYSITGVSFGIVNWATTTVNFNIRAEVSLFDFTSGATTGATALFPNPALVSTFGVFTGVSLGTNTFTVGTLTFGTPVTWSAVDGTVGGFTLKILHDNNNDGVFVEDQNLSTIVSTAATYTAPYVGGSANGYYRDADSSGGFTGSDFRTLTNRSDVGFVVIGEAAPVPEPATLTALGLGAVAILRRRRK